MKRRDMLKGMATIPFIAAAAGDSNAATPAASARRTIKPERLKKGDTVALIAPSSGIEAERFERALKNIEDIGLVPKPAKHARELNGFLAGTDEERLADLHEAFADASVKAVWCIRG